MRKDESMDEIFEQENCVYTPPRCTPCTQKQKQITDEDMDR
jgi:hypothetical protein